MGINNISQQDAEGENVYINQVSVFLENKAGRLAEITGVLADSGVNIRAMSIADTKDFGILRMIVDAPDAACACLKDAGFRVKETPVVGIVLDHKPGGLHKVLKLMDDRGISVEYLYDYLSAGDAEKVTIIAKLENQDDAVAVLKDAGIEFMQ